MPALTAVEILRVWEEASSQPPVDRALTLLAAASPGALRADLARLTVGERDARLLDVREDTFGPHAVGSASCGRCGGRVEFALELASLRVPRSDADASASVDAGGWQLRFRLPDSDDLAACARAADPRRTLAHRCIEEATRDGVVVQEPELGPEALSGLAAAMVERDPQAEILLEYACPDCGSAGRTLFDIAAFLWEEVRAHARRLLLEVATLARAFGWSERDILSMSAARRRAYLEIAT